MTKIGRPTKYRPEYAKQAQKLCRLGDRTAVSDLNPLASLSNLRWLSLNGTEVHKLSPLEKVPNLEHLFIADTNVEQFDSGSLNNVQIYR